MSLSQQGRKFVGVVSLKQESEEGYESVSEVLDKMRSFMLDLCPDIYCYALHDKDVLEDGTPKTLHLHFYIELHKKKRLGTCLYLVAHALGVNPFAVSIQPANSYASCIQYMIHKNDPDKYQYERSVLVTNLPEGELDYLLDSSPDTFNFDYLKMVVENAQTLLDVIQVVGLQRYHGYRNTIKDIWAVIHCS